ncbi:MAG: pirin family protein [Cellvibrionaceae bacterium]
MRKLQKVIKARPARDGDGVHIHRLAGPQVHKILDPFLMIDEINSDQAADYVGGFPQHPHRGFETITYMKTGRMHHRDHMNNEGVIAAGDVQWMTAGAGVLHSEMPEQDQGLLHGFQIWLNLPANEKMKPAAYQEITSDKIVEKNLSSGGLVRIIAGEVEIDQKIQQGPLPDRSTKPVFLDIQLGANESVELAFNTENPALVYVYQGATDKINTRELGVYHAGETLVLQGESEVTKLLVLSGTPINEPIAQYGPFVMNTRTELQQAVEDFNNPVFLRTLAANSRRPL